MTLPETSAAGQRAGWISGMRRLTDILEANPDLPLPFDGIRGPIDFYLTIGRDARREMAALEAALPAGFTGQADNDGTYYDLTGAIDGLKVRVRGYADYVAEKHVTGTTTVETVEWVRLPAEPEEAESSGEDEGPEAQS